VRPVVICARAAELKQRALAHVVVSCKLTSAGGCHQQRRSRALASTPQDTLRTLVVHVGLLLFSQSVPANTTEAVNVAP